MPYRQLVPRKLKFYCDCVNWPPDDVDSLNEMIDESVWIDRPQFVPNVDLDNLWEVEQSLGYVKHYMQGLTMSRDNHVGYYKSTLRGKPVYYFKWSAIEYVFTHGGKP